MLKKRTTLPPQVPRGNKPREQVFLGGKGTVRRDRAPFVSTSLDDYLNRYWCVKFTMMKYAHENREMQRYLSWYAIRCKVVYVDYLPFGALNLQKQIANRVHPSSSSSSSSLSSPPLPCLFVNKKLVGGVEIMRDLEQSARLKDVLQFGFLWHNRPDSPGPDVHPQALPVPPSIYGDEAMFKGTYRGTPYCAPVVKLPRFLPKNSITHDDDS